jgi:pimeloyl-ACP methyl ester carboxylesterase
MPTIFLIHGGLWDEGMNAARFWHDTGVVDGLRGGGLDVLAPDRLARAPSWQAEVDHLAGLLPAEPVTVLAGSNGCSAAARLALAFPSRVARLLLAWPATVGDRAVDGATRRYLTRNGATPEVAAALVAGETLRGVTDGELAALRAPAGILPSVPENRTHQRHTADALLRLVPGARELPGCPEPPTPDFPGHLAGFLRNVGAFATA